MKPKFSRDNLCLIAGCIVLLGILLLPTHNRDMSWGYFDTLQFGSSLLKGQSTAVDVVQDMIGFRALLTGGDPYPILGQVIRALGIEWQADLNFASTHPPTAFLLTAPVAMLPLKLAIQSWAWLMLVSVGLSFHFLGFNWKTSIGLGLLSLLWIPTVTSLPQLTPVWLLGIAGGYYFKDKHPYLSGILIGLAALTKIIPGLVIILFVLKRKWKPVISFSLVIIFALAIVYVLDPTALSRYLDISRTNMLVEINRLDNGSILSGLYKALGWWGYLVLVLLIGLISKQYLTPAHLLSADISEESNLLISYLAVLLLPLAWTFSLLLILPNLIWSLKTKLMIPISVAVICILIPQIYHPFGGTTILSVGLPVILMGLNLFYVGMKGRNSKAEVLLGEPLGR